MFLVFNKEKICSYLVSLGTVAILFVMAIAITNRNESLIESSANAIISNNIKKNEYNINSEQIEANENVIKTNLNKKYGK